MNVVCDLKGKGGTTQVILYNILKIIFIIYKFVSLILVKNYFKQYILDIVCQPDQIVI